MKRTLATILITAVGAVTANARIGYTLSECQAQYGEITKVTGNGYQFTKNGFVISISLSEGGRVNFISYQKKFMDHYWASLTPIEIGVLLNNNADGATWVYQAGEAGEDRQDEGAALVWL